MNEASQKKTPINDIRFVKSVPVGSINPAALLSDEGRNAQEDLLNRCLNDYPKGIIIGKDISIGKFVMGEHELTMQKTVYHIGFNRKPIWMENGGENP